MAKYQNLINSISSVIRTNGNNEITGQILQDVLKSIVNVVGANPTYGGVAHPADNPGTPDGGVVYIASDEGTYVNFGGLTIASNELAVLVWDGTSWSKESVTYIEDLGDIEEAKQEALAAIAEAIQGLNIYYTIETDKGTVKDVQLKDGQGNKLMPITNYIYDVSAMNPTAGHNMDGKFESLSALLSDNNLDTLIPNSVRKGGMSIKYVQVADNKYVQYFLTKDEWSADAKDWVQEKSPYPYVLIGIGFNSVTQDFSNLVIGRYYEITFDTLADWSIDSITGNVVVCGLYEETSDNREITLLRLNPTQFVSDFKGKYIFKLQNQGSVLRVLVRADIGVRVSYKIEPSCVVNDILDDGSPISSEGIYQHFYGRKTIGRGQTSVTEYVDGLKKGQSYKLEFMDDAAWDITGVTTGYAVLALSEADSNGTILKRIVEIKTSDFQDRYKKTFIVRPSYDDSRLIVFFRIKKGDIVYWGIHPYTTINNVPEYKSPYPVSSGAANNVVAALKMSVSGEDRNIPFSKTGYYVTTQGVLNTSSNWYQSNVFRLFKNEVVEIICGTTGGGQPIIVLTDLAQTFYTPVVIGHGAQQSLYKYKAVEDCYVLLQYYQVTSSPIIYADSERLAELEGYVNTLIGKNINERVVLLEKNIAYILPEYALQEKERVYNYLLTKVNGNASIVAFNTDQHFAYPYSSGMSANYNPKYVMNGLYALLGISESLPLDAIVLGGDVASYDKVVSNKVNTILGEVDYLCKPFGSINTPFVSIPGNHEAFQNNSNVTAVGMYNVNFKRSKWMKNIVHSGIDNCDCYFDDADKKIRYICLDTMSRNGRTETYSDFLESALSSLADGYMALIFSHTPLTNEFAGVVRCYNSSGTEVDAFQNPTDVHAILNLYSSKIIACICGHSHVDAYGVSSAGILYIETTTAASHTLSHDNTIPYQRTLNSPTETAYDILVIDQVSQTIEAVRYGQGTNRKWKYKGTGQGLISNTNYVGGVCSVGSVTLVFTNNADNSDVVSVVCDSSGNYSAYLTLGATYTISCQGYTLDVNSVQVTENKTVNITATSE